MKVLSINPGSTSTKIAVFEDGKQVFLTNIKHSAEAVSYTHLLKYQVLDMRSDNDYSLLAKGLVERIGCLLYTSRCV